MTVSLRRILLPTDLGGASRQPFVTAVKLTASSRGQLQVLNVHPPGDEAHWEVLPTVRDLLVSWGVLHAQADVESYRMLDMHVQLTDLEGRDPVAVLAAAAGLSPWDLMIAGNRRRSDLQRWGDPSVSEPLSRALVVPTLFLPDHVHPLVDEATGQGRLKRVLIPVGAKDHAERAVEHVVALAEALGVERATGVLLHMGQGEMPDLDLSSAKHWSWSTDVRSGALVDGVAQAAQDHDIDLVAMTTHGHDSLRDTLFGSVTERVLHKVNRPVLAVPDPV